MTDFTFLTIDKIFGSNGVNQLSIFEKTGVKAVITDLAILLGGITSNEYYFNDEVTLSNRTGEY